MVCQNLQLNSVHLNSIPSNNCCVIYSNVNLTECGNTILDRYEFSADTSFAVGWNFLAMGVFLGTFIILGFVGLLASTRRK